MKGLPLDLDLDPKRSTEGLGQLAKCGQFRVSRPFKFGDAALGHADPIGELDLVDPEFAAELAELVCDEYGLDGLLVLADLLDRVAR